MSESPEPPCLHADVDEALTGRVRSFQMPVCRMVEDAMNAVRQMKNSPLGCGSRRESLWWSIVFEEAMLAIEDHVRQHGSIPWQPRFIVDARLDRDKAGFPRPRVSRREERVHEFVATCKILAQLESPDPKNEK